ncbi:MAG TPA: hypothetical protein VGK70_01000 [Thermoanaerobaculia bacterium]|jgi:hypothetical protein
MPRRERPGVFFKRHDGERRKGCLDEESATEKASAREGKARRRARPKTPTVDLGIAGWRVPIHSHIAYLWETKRDFEEAVGFLAAGLEGSDHCIVVGDEGETR